MGFFGSTVNANKDFTFHNSIEQLLTYFTQDFYKSVMKYDTRNYFILLISTAIVSRFLSNASFYVKQIATISKETFQSIH